MLGHRTLRCSFCGKDETQVSKLVAGPKVFICDSCTAKAARIIKESDVSPPPMAKQDTRRSALRRLWRALLGQPLRRMPMSM